MDDARPSEPAFPSPRSGNYNGGCVCLAGGRRHSVESLIAASRERLERWREVATVLPSIAVIVTLADDVPSDAPDIVLSPSEWRVVAHLDGRRSIADITRLLGASAFDVCATLHRLVTAGAAKVVDAG